MKRNFYIVLAILFAAFVVSLFTTPVARNAWSLVTDGSSFFVPRESSVFAFRITSENMGSGDWWLTGEDGANFFAIDDELRVYYVFPRNRVDQCAGFNRLRVSTWCKSLATSVRY